jgi:hypothetical protein
MDGRDRSLKSTNSGCWCVSKGLAGMVSQMSGLAQAVGVDYECFATPLRLPWAALPPPLIPRSPGATTNPAMLTRMPGPRLLISCGRHGVIPALYLRKKYGDRIFVVQLQDPKTDPSQFDMVVVPKHDYLRGDNVYLTTGAVHHVTPDVLDKARNAPAARQIVDGDSSIVAVLVGGPNGYYSFRNSDVDHLIELLKNVVANHRLRLVILPSNRTPASLSRTLRTAFGKEHFVWSGEGDNPYLSALANAKHIVVTGDSVSMVTEAVSTGKPVFVHHLTEKRTARRFRHFHESFETDGFTRPFKGQLDEWTFQPPNDTAAIARIIKARIGIDDISPSPAVQNRAA